MKNKDSIHRVKSIGSRVKKIIFREYPKSACVQITSKCNLKCEFCEIWKDPQEIDAKTIKKIIDQLALLRVSTIGISGGEPTLHKDLWEIIKYAKSKLMYVSVTTNGLILREELISKINDSNLDIIKISLDGLSDVHNKIRGMDGCFERVMSGMRILDQCRCAKEIATVITPYNIGELLELEKLAIDLNFSFALTLVASYGNVDKKLLEIDVKSLEFILNKLRLPKSRELLQKIINALRGKIKYCILPYKRFTIRYDLSLSPCTFLKGMGDLREDSIKKLYNDRKYRILKHRCYKRELPTCKTCFIWATR